MNHDVKLLANYDSPSYYVWWILNLMYTLDRTSCILFRISILERYVTNTQYLGDNPSYETKLDIRCLVHDLTPFLKAGRRLRLM